MTNEEAINVLEDYDINFERHTAEAIAEAHEMAIKALEEQPCEDCVSREAVLSIIKSICFSEEYLQFRVDYGSNGQRDAVINRIKALPSVSPQPSERTEMNECDCISRQAVIDALHRYFADGFDGDKWWNSTYVLSAINEVPSTQPNTQPKEECDCISRKGHWIEHKHGGIEHIECSKCRCWFLRKNLIRNSYCPNCGSYNGGTK